VVTRKQTRGMCTFCGREMAKSGLTRHLSSCKERQLAIKEAEAGPGETQTLYHLQVLDAWSGTFWLHLEMNGAAPLKDLDTYLRAIWLECCGHLSRFSFGGWSGAEIPMTRRVEQVLRMGTELTHIYDFGTSSETLIRVVGTRKGKPLTRHPIKLMGRNNPPDTKCSECDQPARWWCPECTYEHDEPGFLCDEHLEVHPHADYEITPLVNSPRFGMCAYSGPAEPPY
jgi:hypothetical protein